MNAAGAQHHILISINHCPLVPYSFKPPKSNKVSTTKFNMLNQYIKNSYRTKENGESIFIQEYIKNSQVKHENRDNNKSINSKNSH